MENPEHEVTVPVPVKYREGWGVSITPITKSEEDERIADIEVEVVHLCPANEVVCGSVLCMRCEGGSENVMFPVSCFRELDDLTYDDTHDLRDRWFATEEEARKHAEATIERFKNPLPWESFVQL